MDTTMTTAIDTALTLEPRAGEVLGLHQDALPAVLHSPAYAARQPVTRHGPGRADWAARAAAERRWRAQMLTSLAGRYRMVIGTHALYFLHARFPNLLRDQIGHLLHLIDEHRVTLQVLPTDVHNDSLRHGIVILRHLPQQRDQAYLQQHTSWIAVPDMASHLVAAWEQVHRIAFSAADTRTHLHHAHETGDVSIFGPARGWPPTIPEPMTEPTNRTPGRQRGPGRWMSDGRGPAPADGHEVHATDIRSDAAAPLASVRARERRSRTHRARTQPDLPDRD